MLDRIVVISAVGAAAALLGACSVENRVVGEDVCAGYGLSIGSSEYRKCRDQEAKSGKGYTPEQRMTCLLYTSPSPRDGLLSRMPSSA